MFTGIISHLGKVRNYQNKTFTFDCSRSFSKAIKKGSSVAINGVCLTVDSVPTLNTFKAEVMPETLRRTALADLAKGDLVNLELPVKAKDLLSGHIVQGHVDGVAVIEDIKKEGNSWLFEFAIAKKVSRYIVEKGSVAVNGISLTVIETGDKYFTVGIIPYTWDHTMLKNAKVGDRVNIEVDILAKYLEKLIKSYLKRQNVKKTD